MKKNKRQKKYIIIAVTAGFILVMSVSVTLMVNGKNGKKITFNENKTSFMDEGKNGEGYSVNENEDYTFSDNKDENGEEIIAKQKKTVNAYTDKVTGETVEQEIESRVSGWEIRRTDSADDAQIEEVKLRYSGRDGIIEMTDEKVSIKLGAKINSKELMEICEAYGALTKGSPNSDFYK